MFSPPIPEEEISDYIAHGPFIRVFTVDRNSSINVLVTATGSLLLPPLSLLLKLKPLPLGI